MIKEFRKYVNQKTAEWMKVNHPGFKKIKLRSKGTSLTHCNIFEKRQGESKAWIVIGGQSDSLSLIAELYWTHDGYDWEDDEEKFLRWKDGVVPRNGCCQLTDGMLVGGDLPIDGGRLIWFPDPPVEIQEFALSERKKTEIHKKSRELRAKQMRAKNPEVTDEEIDASQDRGLRAGYKVWSGVVEAIELDDVLIGKVLDDVLTNKVFYLLEKYGIPLIERQLTE